LGITCALKCSRQFPSCALNAFCLWLHRYEYGILRVGSRQQGGRAFPLQLRDCMGGRQQRSDMGSQVYKYLSLVYLCCVIYLSLHSRVLIAVMHLGRVPVSVISSNPFQLTHASSRYQDGWYNLAVSKGLKVPHPLQDS